MKKRSLAPFVLVVACASAPPLPPPPPAATAAPASADAGLELSEMDRSVEPGDDFFRFVNGRWLDRTEIPADESAWGTFSELGERALEQTRDVVEQAAKAPGASADARKVGDYYASIMDEGGIEAKGMAPLRPALAAISQISDARTLARALGETVRADVDVINTAQLTTPNIFGVWVAQDLDDPTKYSPALLQGGLILPDRDYYLSAEPRMKEIREKYRMHMAAMLRLAGIEDAEKRASRVLDLETKLARVHATRADTWDVKKGNNHWPKAELAKRAPGLDWSAFLQAAQLDGQPTLVIWQPPALVGIAALVKSQPLEAWKDLLAFHTIELHAPVLPRVFDDEAFVLAKLLDGMPAQPDRWKRAVRATDEAVGELVGRLYVERYFPASEKKRAEEMVRNVVAAFARRIDALPWMSPGTKRQAQAKLAGLKVGIGYPDTWPDYASLEIVRGDAFGNRARADRFAYRRHLAKLGKAVDRGEWAMNPQVVNAVNLPAMNALNFPAAILQPPAFDARRASALDYGAMGAIIGHEICHSFDDTGAQFDATGKLANWWTEEDLAHFRASSAGLAAQYDAYRPFPDAHVDGKLTSEENIADVAGLGAAFDAYRMANGGKEGPSVQGLSGDQQFFLSYARFWRLKVREETARKWLLVDGHAPSEYRADTVRNLDAWYTAWNVKPGQKLHLAPKDRARIY